MDIPKIVTWIFAGIGALQGILYFEEWWRNKFPKTRGGGVITESKNSTIENKMKSPSAFLTVLAVVGFTISGSFWINNIEQKINNLQKQADAWSDFYKNRGLDAGVTMANNLPSELSSNPLGTGAAEVGWIPIHINGITDIQEGTHFIISFEDVYGRKTVIDHDWMPPFN